MSRYKSDPEIADYESTKCCTSFLHYSWKTITCLFSHVTLVSMVVSYCVLGAFTFEALEVENEKLVKRGIYKIRENITWHLWNFTQEMKALNQDNFTSGAVKYLKYFENSLLDKMNKEGWDGEEDPNKVQWTRTGSLFYSIIVITTIGYGHIAPKTTWGKVVTIFYAILGIPLMLLCLSNIGDVMATSFRFLYWRVCCYMCQKKPKKMKRGRSIKGSFKSEGNKLSRSRNGSFRRYTRSPRAYDKRFGDMGPTSHSDTELRNNSQTNGISKRSVSMPPRRARSMTRNRQFLELPRTSSPESSEIEEDLYSLKSSVRPKTYPSRRTASPGRRGRPRGRSRSPVPPLSPSPKMMTPIGYGLRSRYLEEDSDTDYYYDGDSYDPGKTRIRPVPIWLCVFLVVSYILAGAYLFMTWEGWEYLDAAYFCFITLTTIGFGDLVPAKEVSRDNDRAAISIALCSLYLLFGISLLAMSFNLVQEEVIANVKSVAKGLGIIKSNTDDEEDD